MGTPRMTEAMIEEACTLREAGRTIGSIALRLGVKDKTVDYHLRKNGAFPPGWKHLGDRRRPENRSFVDRLGRTVRAFTPEEDRQLQKLAREGLGNAAIGRELGRRPNSIRARLTALANRAQCAEEIQD